MMTTYKILFRRIESLKKLVHLPSKLAHPDITYNQLLLLEKDMKDVFQELDKVKCKLNDYTKRRSGPR